MSSLLSVFKEIASQSSNDVQFQQKWKKGLKKEEITPAYITEERKLFAF